MPADPDFDVEALHRGLVAVDRAATSGSKRFVPEDVPDGERGRLYAALLQRGWVERGPDTSITGTGELRLPPRLTAEGRQVLAALEQADLLSFVAHPPTAEIAWSELIRSLGALSSAAAEAHASRSELRRWGVDEGRPSIIRAIQRAEVNGLRWSPDDEAFVPSAPPRREEIFLEEVDEFARIRTVASRDVTAMLTNGRIDLLEDVVQHALEQILGESFHMTDHGGEECDLFSTNVTIDGRRVPTAFLLKGRGARAAELQIADCGHNGDQIVRLLQSPAELYVIQYIGPVSQNVRKDVRGKVRERRARGDEASFAVMDGLETTRLLVAYGQLAAPT
jgi:hypothetical protein